MSNLGPPFESTAAAEACEDARPPEPVLLPGDDGSGGQPEGWRCSGPKADFPVETTYACHFQAQAERAPNGSALRFRGQELTYAELNARANALARYLQTLGVGPDVVVGVCVERSLELMVALLAVLKAGGAYLPLDPNYPEERRTYMLADSGAPLLITQARFRAMTPGRVVCLDEPAERTRIAQCSGDNPNSRAGADNLAYVIYTSGSTGTPKGVEVTHRSLLSHNFAVAQAFGLSPADRVLQFTPLSFDVSVEEIFPSWLCGSAVIVRTEEAISSMTRFLDLVEQEGITVLNLPTAFWHELVEALGSRALPATIRLVVVGGEKASEAALERWQQRVSPSVSLMNGYGVTEATITTTLGLACAEEQALPIGRPLANMHVVLLDEQLQPVAPGQAGELCIGGPGLARGYANRPELTAERFITNPGLPGLGRLYRTGDQARLRADGNLEFLGRQDQQVKVRGFRIELGEIETVLLSHPAVKEAAVIAREDQPGRQRLVCYFVPRTAPGPRVGELLKYLRARLPDYMAPAAFVPLTSLPKTPAGKVDRAALPRPTSARPELDEPLVAPRTPVEDVLAEIWAEVLDLHPVGVNDNFFELGGHSLLAMQVLSRLREQLQVDLMLESMFAQPTIAQLAEHLAESSEQARPALAASALARGQQLELTPAQRRIWFLDQFEPQRAAYNRPMALRLHGTLNLPALERSLTELARRHPTLRAVFPAREGEPIQHICEPREVNLPRVDLADEPEYVRASKALEIFSRRGRQPYITFRPMLRPLLARLGPTEHWLLLGLHELGVDSHSVRVLVEELATLYRSLASNGAAPLASTPAGATEVVAQLRPSSPEPSARDRAYWKRQLAGAPALLELPTDRPRPPHHGAAGARHTFELPPALLEQLQALAEIVHAPDTRCRGRREESCLGDSRAPGTPPGVACNGHEISGPGGPAGGELFSVLLAGFGTVLHRYTGSTDLVIGSVVPGRGDPQQQRSIVHLENPVALRCDLSGNPTFLELVRRVQETAAGARAHGDFPFETLLEELQPERNPSYAPIVQVMFVVEQEALPERNTGGLNWVPFELDNQTAKYDLTLHLSRRDGRLAGWLEYSTDLFEPARIARLAGHLATLLAGAVANPEQRLSTLPLLSPAERHQLLVEWNSTAVVYPRERCLHELLEAQVERTPEATAVSFQGQSLTYTQLNARANQLAHRLRALGVGPDTLVGLCLERSVEMVVGLLGTLKAGGAYVPLDPEYPPDRLGFMVADAGVPVLLTQSRLRDMLPARPGHTLFLDSDWPDIATESSANRAWHVQPQHLAYMIYTSGSTGRPKGALNTHAGIVNRLLWMQDAYHLDSSDRVLQKTPFSFDVSVWEFFWPLLTGAGLVVAQPGGHRDTAYLAGLIEQERITTLHFVPSMLRLFLEQPGLEQSCAGVRRVICSGEALPLDLQQRFFERFKAELHNLYGPTEAAVDVTYWACQRDTKLRTVPIGRPIANTQIYLLDRALQPVPIGVPGELHIGGIGLARGYHKRPELTAEKFIANPFSPAPGARLYKTGDSARYLEDGNIEYLGRLDFQVKIRGNRVELGEIEAGLKEHPGVAEALVLARENGPGDKRLVAFIVPARGQSVTDAELRRFLEPRLPGYMVPAGFVQLDALPLTPNGKVDRKALTALETEQPDSARAFVAPRNPVEEQVAAIWREVLRLKRVGAEDNFFDLGGDSLLAIRVISRLREVFKVEVPLFKLFNAPTVAALAAGLAEGQSTPSRGLVLPLEPVSREAPLPVSFVQERLWFLDQLEPGSHAYNVPLALRLRGDLNPAALERALNEVVRRHEALRTTYSYADDQLTQVISPSLQLALQRRPEDASEPIDDWLQAEAQRPFDLAQGPLIRVFVARLAEREHALLVVMHHSVCDGWSLALLFQELAALYAAFQAGRPAPALPELPVQYADFAYWQRRWMRGAVLGQELKYWQEKLAGAPPAVTLPADHPEPAQPTSRGGRRTVRVPETVARGIAELGHRQGDTPFMVLMSALAITLQKWTAQEDLVIGTVVAGRNRREVENLIGCFMNFLPVRTQVRPQEAGQEILARVRAAVLEAQTHQDCPFERIVEALNPRRGLNRNPLYNVALLLQNFPSEPFRTETLQASPIAIAMDAALLDLRFEAEHAGPELLLSCEYRSDLFEASTIDALLAAFGQCLELLVREPQTTVADFRLSPELVARAATVEVANAEPKIAIAATFTAEPLLEPLRHWLTELGLPSTAEFAPYHQVFQQLLDPGSLLSGNQQGLNILLVRMEDWQGSGAAPGSTDGQPAVAALERTAGEFIGALNSATARSANRWLVCLCPPSTRVTTDPKGAALLARLEESLVAELGRLNGVEVLTAAELARWYPVANYYDPSADELGHVPYTPVFFTALATAIARKYDALHRAAHKVIVLDCDQTLWGGVCGEDGAQGVRLDLPYLALQNFMRAQGEAGRLLCLCSKNNAADVDEVFARRQDMPLRPEHFVARRLNWRPKSENLKALAQELKLGLDAFILVDDNPVECAEVEANCPEVLTLRLPESPERFPEFLQHCWVFDTLKLTAEDRRRTELYRQNREREQLRNGTQSLAEFLAGLELQIEIGPIGPEQLSRATQLTQRTNQFNCTTRRRTESELQQLLARVEGLAVSVRDRFGDYGLVGVMLFEQGAGALEVDSFLLSCRVLGRGVEHRMLAHLGALARERGCASVNLHFAPTAKNQPALRFLESFGNAFKQGLNGGWVFQFPTAFAAEVRFEPGSTLSPSPSSSGDPSVSRLRSSLSSPRGEGRGEEAVRLPTADPELAVGMVRAGSNGLGASSPQPCPPGEETEKDAATGRARHSFRRYGELALDSADVVKLHERLQARATPVAERRVPYVAPRTEVERTLCQIWEEVLHLDGVGINDNFFELGGHSLLAVQLNSRIRAAFKVELPMQSLFEAQTVTALAEGLAAGQWKASGPGEAPLRPTARPGRLPLSFAQQRLWFLDQLEPNSALYNVPVMGRLRGTLDLGALERSLEAIVARHEALRTRLVGTGDGPVQVVEQQMPLALRSIDLGDIPEAEREAQAQRLAHEEANQPFNLSTGPMLRALVVRLQPDEHLLVVNLHHIVSDEWSMGVLFRELTAFYSGLVRGAQVQLPELPVQYADYALWQRQWLQGQVLEEHLRFWQQHLSGPPPITELPPDHRPPPPPRFRGGLLKRAFDQELSVAVKELARREDATVFMVMLAAFKALLHRYNPQDDITVAAPSAGRNRAELENLIGFFVNTLPLRTDLSGNPSFCELLHRVRTVTLGAYAHQDLPFDKMVEAVQPERSLTHLPFTRLMFGVQHGVPEELQWPGVRLQFLDIASDTAKFDLTLIVEETCHGLLARAEYNSDLFEPATIRRVLQQYEALLWNIAAQPHGRLSDLSLLDQTERRDLLAQWSNTSSQSPPDLCLHQWFQAQAERSPDAVAVVCEQQKLTYAQLNAQANQLAHYLRGLGVGPDVPVALCLERSLSMVVAILGVLKAGGTYVPIDPAYPKERLNFILQDTQAPVLLTQAHLWPPGTAPERGHPQPQRRGASPAGEPKRPALQPGHAAAEDSRAPSETRPGAAPLQVVCLDSDWDKISVCPALNPQPSTLNPQHAAYIIYTSGSTGIPKGVVVTHYNVVRLFQQTEAWYGFNTTDVWTLFHSYTFDFSVWELWGALLYGGRLVVVPYLISRSPNEFYRLLSNEQVTVLNQTPSAFRQLLWAEASSPKPLPLRLRYVIFGGEALELQSLKPWFDRHGDEQPLLVNMYGITETTVHVTYRPIRSADLDHDAGSVIGVPIPDLRLYLLDEKLEPVPVGVPGEICVGGAGVARGYLNRPELSSQRFITDPFVMEPGARLYRSGDLARFTAAGELEYLGRMDHQVKVRGFRVELGEIESALNRHPAIRESVVVAAADGAVDAKRLVAYFTSKGPAPALGEVRDFLAQALPEHMIPSVFMPLPALPLTANGKVDRRALPEPEAEEALTSGSPVAPRNPTEARLAEIWCEVLGRSSVGIRDNFFHLGGHSLLATQVTFRITDTFQVEVPVRALFERPTIEALAEAVSAAQHEQPESPLMIGRRPDAEAQEYPLSFAQEMLWVLDRLEPNSPLYNVPLVARLHGTLDEDRLQRALEAVVARHEILRTRLVARGGAPAQVIDADAAVPLSREDLSDRSEAEREAECQRRLRQENQRPFNLGTDRLFRAKLLRLGPQEHMLALNLHHSVFDEWSLGIFLRELTALYNGLDGGQAVALPELPIQYADYALWQRAYLQDEVLERHLEFWQEHLAGHPAPTELPTDHVRPAGPISRGRLERRVLGGELSEGLKQLAAREEATLFMVLLAAFKTLLFRYTRQEDLVVASPMAGRQRAETEGLLGCFVNILPLRTRIAGDPSFTELLGQVRELALGAYAHEELPFRKLVEALHPERLPNHMPFTNLMFLVQNTVVESLQWPGLTLDFVEATTETSKFDLTLLVQESRRGLVLNAEYKTDLFEAETIRRLLGHFETLLAGIVADPGRKLSALPLLPEAERTQVVVEWNRTEQEYPREKTLVDLFEEQVARTPEAEALVCGDSRLTYRELEARSNLVAQHLRARGVTAEAPVGICLERSWQMVAGILGVLKAGGAYVPLDPAYPRERLAFMLEDSAARVVLTQQKLLQALEGDAQARRAERAILCLDSLEPLPVAPSSIPPTVGGPANPQSAIRNPHSSSLAYIIYTSGSTGKPKGVALEHRSAVALMHWARGVFSSQELAGVLAATSICFDLSIFELFVPLSCGGKVVLADNALALEDLPAAGEVTLVNTVPSVMRELLRLKALPQSVRVVNLAGEPLASELVEQIYREAAVEKVYDLYGPTETTTYSTFTLRRPGALASIGRPLANEQVYVLDAQFQPVPIGVPGELYISGAGLARGYVNRPELTAQRFVANPFQAGARMYRTGDLARWRADGTLEYLGRLDQQVKVRGFRIELGEIEAALREQPAVQEAIVLARAGASGDQQLVAYLEAQSGQSVVEADLRQQLEARLPAYMVPAQLVMLPALPLTPNGKVDRKALAAMPLRSASPEADRVAPRTAGENLLARIWREVLELASVGVQDNFFQLGGHSLLAVRLFARIEESTGQKLPLVTLFQAPTIEQLARLLGQPAAESAQSLLVPIHPAGERAPLFLVHGAGGDVLWGYANLATHLSPDQPVYGIKSRGQAGLPEFNRVEEMAACYLEAVRGFQPVGPYYLGGYCFGGNVAYEMACQLVAQGERVALLVMLDSAPSNIGYEVPGWRHRGYLGRFVRNLRYWLADFAALPGSDRRTFVARKLRSFGRGLARRLRHGSEPAPVDLEGFIDLSHFTEAELKLWRIHLEAASEYIQPSYPGTVTLLRTRGQPLFCSLDEDFCWGRVARSGVVVKRIPGSHESIFTEPNVERLAAELESCLAQARSEAERAKQPAVSVSDSNL